MSRRNTREPGAKAAKAASRTLRSPTANKAQRRLPGRLVANAQETSQVRGASCRPPSSMLVPEDSHPGAQTVSSVPRALARTQGGSHAPHR